jgi:hypothetical protein
MTDVDVDPTGSLREVLLNVIYPLLMGRKGSPPAFPIRVEARDGNGPETVVVFTRHELDAYGHLPWGEPVPPPAPATNGRGLDAVPPPGMRLIHRRLLEQAGPEPLPAKGLISRAGYRLTSYSRDAVTWLCRQRYLSRTPDGLIAGPRTFASGTTPGEGPGSKTGESATA